MRFTVLDSLRGLCALAVVVFHIEIIGGIAAGHVHGIDFVQHSFLFVDFFFVLSGFVLAFSYVRGLNTSHEMIAFMVRRFGRVYPLHLLVLLGFIGLELVKLDLKNRGMEANNIPFTQQYAPSAIVTNMLLLQGLGLEKQATWNTPSWSISVEFYTYLIFSIFVLWKNITGFYQKVGLRPVCIIILIVMCSAIMILEYSTHYIDTIYDYAIFRCMLGFFTGVGAYYFYEKYERNTRVRSILMGSVAEILCILMVAVFVSAVGYTDPVSVAAPFVFVVVVIVFARQGGLVSAMLTFPPFILLGRISYTMYITHAFLIVLLGRVLRVLSRRGVLEFSIENYEPPGSPPLVLMCLKSVYAQDATVILVIGSTVAGSVFLNRFFEEPARAYFNRLAGRLNRARKGAGHDQVNLYRR